MFRSRVANILVLPPLLLLSSCKGGLEFAGPDAGGTPGPDAGGTPVLPPEGCLSGDDPFAVSHLEARIGDLASVELEGRVPGSEGDRLARDYLSASLACLGVGSVGTGFSQPFVDSEGHDTANVIGVLAGIDPDVGHEIIVLSAHHDHLGEDENGDLRLGANDNASGVAALLAVADALVSREIGPKRTLVFAMFGAEELEIDGSKHYVAHPPEGLSIEDTVFIVNMDMVGRYDDEDLLYVLDAMPGTTGRAAVEAVRADFADLNLDLDTEGDLSDQVTFADVGVPGLFFHTPDSECYHQPCDTADRIDYPHLSRTAELITAVVLELANGSL